MKRPHSSPSKTIARQEDMPREIRPQKRHMDSIIPPTTVETRAGQKQRVQLADKTRLQPVEKTPTTYFSLPRELRQNILLDTFEFETVKTAWPLGRALILRVKREEEATAFLTRQKLDRLQWIANLKEVSALKHHLEDVEFVAEKWRKELKDVGMGYPEIICSPPMPVWITDALIARTWELLGVDKILLMSSDFDTDYMKRFWCYTG